MYAILKNNKILKVLDSSTPERLGVIAETLGLADYTEIRKVDDYFEGVSGEDIRQFRADGRRKTEEDALAELGKTLENNQRIVFDDGYKIIDSYLGQTVYSTETGMPIKCETDEIPEGFTMKAPVDDPCTWDGAKWVVDIDSMKAAKLEEIKAEYEVERTTRNKGIESITLGVKIDCREKDVLNIQSIVYVYDATGMAPTFYKAYDNSEVTATGEDFKSVMTELIAAQLAMWQHKNELSRQVYEATKPEQVKSIKWSW